MIGIYKITNPKGKIYVGQSVDIEDRKRKYSVLECKNQFKIYNSLLKYGWEQHKFEIIEECSKELLNEREIYWGLKFDVLGKDGLNLKLGNSNGFCSEETKQKISKSNMNKIISNETRNKISKSKKGHPCYNSEDFKKKISNAQKGKKRPKLSLVLKGRKRPNHSLLMKGKPKPKGFGELIKNNKERSKKISDSSKGISKVKLNKSIICLDKDFNYIKEYNSQKEANLELGIAGGLISKGIKMNYIINGFRWMFKEEYINKFKK